MAPGCAALFRVPGVLPAGVLRDRGANLDARVGLLPLGTLRRAGKVSLRGGRDRSLISLGGSGVPVRTRTELCCPWVHVGFSTKIKKKADYTA